MIRWRYRSFLIPLASALLAGCVILYQRAGSPIRAMKNIPEQDLRAYVKKLATEIGERNAQRFPSRLREAEDWISGEFRGMGYVPKRQAYEAGEVECANIEAELLGTKSPDEIIIIGGHYDSVVGSPGANDNGSGIAATLALAKSFAKAKLPRTVRFVAFVNEEPPYFQTEKMGSLVYARACGARKEKIRAMLSLETMGYFSDEPNSQRYPPLLAAFYPKTGNFIGVVGNPSSHALVQRVADLMESNGPVPVQKAVFPPGLAEGVGWSDHWSFWQEGYPAAMITDTATYRYPHYHEPSDTPDKLDYRRFHQVVEALRAVIAQLAGMEN